MRFAFFFILVLVGGRSHWDFTDDLLGKKTLEL